MKKGIHPQYFKSAKVFVGGEEVYTVGSTKQQISLDVWSKSHPFWNNKSTGIVDSDKLVDKFDRRASMMKSSDQLTAKKAKITARIAKAKEIKSSNKITLKDMMKNLGK